MARNTAYSGSNKQHAFSMIPSATVPRSVFNRSSIHSTTFDSGTLIPIYLDQDILPGDTVKINTQLFGRMATPIYPLMSQLFLDTFWFFVPNRILWTQWPFFMGEEETPGDVQIAAKYTTPQVLLTETPTGSLSDYFGLPLTAAADPDVRVSALPFRAYNKIYNDWFRDESLVPRAYTNLGGGLVSGSTPDPGANYPLRSRGKRKDYVSGSLPWPQKGPTVLLPLGTSAPVIPSTVTGIPTFVQRFNPGAGSFYSEAKFALDAAAQPAIAGSAIRADTVTTNTTTQSPAAQTDVLRWLDPQLTVNLSGATSATINELRQSFQVQRLLERDARGGSRLIELVKSHFGVTSPDSRLQRAEFLGGSTTNVQMNPVPQTSESTANSVQGGLSAFATLGGRGGSFSQSFTEHGILICLCSVRAPLTYQEGLHKSWTRKTRFDHYWPALQALGEQPVKNSEVMFRNNPTLDDAAWGYQERWSEYRFKPNMVTGQFRSSSPTPIDSWHLAIDFNAIMPTLGEAFIADKPPIDRVVAVPSEPEFLLDAYFDCKQTRVMPVYSVPGMIDHF